MRVRPIRTKADYRRALTEAERLWEAEPGTPDGDRVDALVTLIEAYEAKQFPIPEPDPIRGLGEQVPVTARKGTLGEFMAWTQRVVRDPKAAKGVPKRWVETRQAATVSRKRARKAGAIRSKGQK